MKYFPLVWASLFRRKTRTVLTLASIIVAFILFGLLSGLMTALYRGVEVAGADRLVTQGKYSLTEVLPIGYYQQIEQIPGVTLVTHGQWFGGVYQDPKNFFAQFAVDPETYLEVYSEFTLPREQLEAFRRTRTGAVVGRTLADRFGWKIGDRIPIQATIWPKADGSNTWEFELVGIFSGSDRTAKGNEGMMLFHWDYFDEARQFGKGTTGIYITRVADASRAAGIARAIDARFANSRNETTTGSEKAFNLNFIKQIGDIGFIMQAILGAVFFTILLVTANAMAQSVRERIPEMAILKTLGFTDGRALALVFSESLLLAVLGGLIGLALVSLMAPAIAQGIQNFFPDFAVGRATWLLGVSLAIALGFVTGLLPALKARRLRIVDALSGH